MCGHFMVNIGVSFFTATINHFDIVVLGVRRIKRITSLKDIEEGLTSLLKT